MESFSDSAGNHYVEVDGRFEATTGNQLYFLGKWDEETALDVFAQLEQASLEDLKRFEESLDDEDDAQTD